MKGVELGIKMLEEFTAIRLLAPCTGYLAFLDHQEIVYISGRVVVIFNRTTQTQIFLPPRNSSYVTPSFSVSPDG